jgi:hypothetical protein
VLFVVLAVGAMGESVASFEEGPCDTELAKAEADCKATNAKHQQEAKDTCGSADYEARMKKVAQLKSFANKQNELITSSTKALGAAKASAAKVAEESGKERVSLLAMLAKQKKMQAEYAKNKEDARINKSKMTDLKSQADKATEAAVKTATETSDDKLVSAAKIKAHTTYQQYVDEEIKMASLQRKVSLAHKALEDVTSMVEKEIEKAKNAAEKEASALKGIAQAKSDRSREIKVEAVMQAKASVKTVQAASQAAHLLETKKSKAAQDIKSSQENLDQAKIAAKNAKDAASKIQPANRSYTFDMAKLQQQAQEAIGSPVPPPQAPKEPKKDIHEEYADKVKAIEKQRVTAAQVHKEAMSVVSKLTSEGAPPTKIEAARRDVKTAAANMEKLVQQQNAAVSQVVNEIKNDPN